MHLWDEFQNPRWPSSKVIALTKYSENVTSDPWSWGSNSSEIFTRYTYGTNLKLLQRFVLLLSVYKLGGVHIRLPACAAGCWQYAINLLRLRRKKRTTGNWEICYQPVQYRRFSCSTYLPTDFTQQKPETSMNHSEPIRQYTHYCLATSGCIRSNMVDKSWARCAWHHVEKLQYSYIQNWLTYPTKVRSEPNQYEVLSIKELKSYDKWSKTN